MANAYKVRSMVVLHDPAPLAFDDLLYLYINQLFMKLIAKARTNRVLPQATGTPHQAFAANFYLR
jgi:hypothetical protein